MISRLLLLIVALSTDVAYEDLFAFEYTNTSDRVFESSVKGWHNLLRNFGRICEDIVKEALIPHWISMKMEQSYSSVICNANEIKDALDASPFRDYFESSRKSYPREMNCIAKSSSSNQ